MTQPSVSADCVVSFHYTLTLEDGSVVDSSNGHEPMAYLHGHAGIVPGLERQLTGRKPGEELLAVVPPAEGYGEFDPAAEQAVPRAAFGENKDHLKPGMQFTTQTPQGEVMPLWIKTVQGDQVVVTGNHPLAGRTLHFQIKITGVRKATKEELHHGHVHGAGGHHH